MIVDSVVWENESVHVKCTTLTGSLCLLHIRILQTLDTSSFDVAVRKCFQFIEDEGVRVVVKVSNVGTGMDTPDIGAATSMLHSFMSCPHSNTKRIKGIVVHTSEIDANVIFLKNMLMRMYMPTFDFEIVDEVDEAQAFCDSVVSNYEEKLRQRKQRAA